MNSNEYAGTVTRVQKGSRVVWTAEITLDGVAVFRRTYSTKSWAQGVVRDILRAKVAA